MFFITNAFRLRLYRDGAVSRYAQVQVGSASYRMHYSVAGDGPPLVLVHGLNGSGENWTGILPALQQAGFRVYLVDLLGHGRSEQPDIDYSMPLQAEALHSFLEGERLGPVNLVGISMGGWVSLKLAATWPQAVHALILIDSAGTTLQTDVDPKLFEPQNESHLQQLLAILTPHPPQLPGFLARDFIRFLQSYGWVTHRAVQSMFSGADLVDDQLGQIPAPTLIVWGQEDQLIPLSSGQYLHQHLKGSEIETYPGCGHLILELCGPQITPRMTEFLQRHR